MGGGTRGLIKLGAIGPGLLRKAFGMICGVERAVELSGPLRPAKNETGLFR